MGGDDAGDGAGKHDQPERVRIGVDRATDRNVTDRERGGPRSDLEDADGVVAADHGGECEEGDPRSDQAHRPVDGVLGDVPRDDEEVEPEKDAGEDGEQRESAAGGVLAGVCEEDPKEGRERYQVGGAVHTERWEIVTGEDEQEGTDEDGPELETATAEPAAGERSNEADDREHEGDLEDEQRGDLVVDRRIVTESERDEDEIGQQEVVRPDEIGGWCRGHQKEGQDGQQAHTDRKREVQSIRPAQAIVDLHDPVE